VSLTRSDVLDRPSVYRAGLFADQRAIVSGGGSGIGQGIALLLAELGADVVICGRRPEPLAESKDLIEGTTGRRCITTPMNIREPEAVDALFAKVQDELGGFELLVNNAGGQFPAHALDISDKGWRAVIDNNLNGTWTMMQRAAQHWRDAERPGAIVNIIAPLRGMYGLAHTVASRAGIAALSRNVAVEWAPFGIRVNCVLPGSIATRGHEVYDPAVREQMARAHPLGRNGSVQDIAEAVAYLAAPSGDFVTAEVLHVDGGQQAHGSFWQAGRPEGWDAD
jgi:citronellol/citronellal dehydrogenase